MRNSLKDTRFCVFKAGIFGFASVLFVLLCVFSCNNLLVLGSGGTLIVSVPGDDLPVMTLQSTPLSLMDQLELFTVRLFQLVRLLHSRSLNLIPTVFW